MEAGYIGNGIQPPKYGSTGDRHQKLKYENTHPLIQVTNQPMINSKGITKAKVNIWNQDFQTYVFKSLKPVLDKYTPGSFCNRNKSHDTTGIQGLL